MMKNKKGWIRIVEAFIAILLITGAILIVLNKGYLKKTDVSSQMYDIEVAILREIELDDGLREIVLKLTTLPVKWDNPNFPGEIKTKIMTRAPEYLNCVANICELNDVCAMDNYVDGDVYAQAVAIVANLQIYNPRQVKLFCWEK